MWRLGCLSGAGQTQRHLALGQHSATWRLVCLLLGAAQASRGAWVAYTFVALGLLALGCSPIVTWHLGCLYL